MQEAGHAERSGEALKHAAATETQGETAEAPVDQPVIRSTLERFVYAVDRTDHGVTGHVGLPVAIEAFHALGLAEAWGLRSVRT